MEMFDLFEKLKPYTTCQEKDALLYSSNLDEVDLTILLIKLGVNKRYLKGLNNLQLNMLVFKLREISVGDIVEVRYTCKHCKSPTVGQVSIPNMFKDSKHPDIHSDIEVGFFTEDEIEEKIEEKNVLAEMSITDYDSLVDKYNNNNENLFSRTNDAGCLLCHKDNYITLEPHKIISKSTLTDIYNNYNDLSFYAHHGFNDISNMLPFERELLMILLQNTIDKDK